MPQSRDKRAIGSIGEEATAGFLAANGYEILERNYTIRGGEIDIIARKNGVLCFVEVKTRKDARFALAREAVTPAKQRRIAVTARFWLAETRSELQPRFDVIEVYYGEDFRAPRIEHLENAFTL